jgi:hypothetical protein
LPSLHLETNLKRDWPHLSTCIKTPERNPKSY